MLSTAVTLGGGLGGLVAAKAEVSEGYVVALGAVDRDCGYGREGYAWRVGGGAAAAGHTGSTNRRRHWHWHYCFSAAPSREAPYALRFRYHWTLWPALRALSGWVDSFTRFALAYAARDKPVWSAPSPITDKTS